MSCNDDFTFERIANEANAERHSKAEAPVRYVYAALLQCARAHMEHNDVTSAEAIINALQLAMEAARNWAKDHPTTASQIAADCNY